MGFDALTKQNQQLLTQFVLVSAELESVRSLLRTKQTEVDDVRKASLR
jgi:hypothetical protein